MHLTNATFQVDKYTFEVQDADVKIYMTTTKTNEALEIKIDITAYKCKITSEQFSGAFDSLTIHVDARKTENTLVYTATAHTFTSLYQLLLRR